MFRFRKISSGDSRFCLYCMTFACVLTIGSGYNLDTVNRMVFTDPNIGNTRASYFGFSTALYVKTGTDGRRRASVIVGAPRANASAIPSVFEPGTVFNCAINEGYNNSCIEWNLDPTVNGRVEHKRISDTIQLKNNAWTGGSIGVDYTRVEYPQVMVCAPNWKDVTGEMWYMYGICYWSNGTAGNIFEQEADEKVIPLYRIKDGQCEGKFNRKYGQAGFSMHMYSENEKTRLLFGSPSINSGMGVPIWIKDDPIDPIVPTCITKSNDMSNGTKLPILMKHDEHFGYSVTSGFYYDDKRRYFAASAPSTQDLMGKVLIFVNAPNDTIFVKNKYKLQDPQIGQYFGASLASCDVNDDEKDEIIVGAPFWSSDMDEGRIYVFSVTVGYPSFHCIQDSNIYPEKHYSTDKIKYQTLNFVYVTAACEEIFTKTQVINGTKSGARFGSVVTCLGDLDLDGYKDIAVGAPYEGNHGAVYIYNGRKEGLNEGFSQRIYGEDISAGIRGFGSAISEPRDVDGNHYVDIAVGACNSGHVILLRSQPTVKMQVNFIKMKNPQSNLTLLTVNVCSTILTRNKESLPLTVETTLKVDPESGFFGQHNDATGVYKQKNLVHTQETECIPYKMTVKKSNVGHQVDIGVSLALAPSSSGKFCATCPVVNKQESKLNDSLSLSFEPYCVDYKCISILDITIQAVPGGNVENGVRYTLGSKSQLRINVQVNNTGQEAYNTKLHFFIPSPIYSGRTPSACKSSKYDNLLQIECPLGNPLGRDPVETTFELDMRNVNSDTEQITLFTNLSSQSTIYGEANHSVNFTIYFDVDVNMAITGKSLPDVNLLEKNDEAQEEKSMRYEHIYTVQKLGMSPMEKSNVTIWVPTHLRKNNIEVVRIIKKSGVMDGQQIDCRIADENQERGTVEKMGSESTSISSDSLIAQSLLKTPDNHLIQDSNATYNSKLYVPPSNRTFYLNCTNQAVKCVQISCKLNKFDVSNTVAKINITLDVQLQNLIPVAMKTKDIIYLVSNASVSGITRSGKIHQRIETEFNSTSIGTTLICPTTALSVATWIIVVSILSGVLLLVLLILGLIKLGFFHRRRKEELETLKAESDNNPGLVLETSSSRDALDAI